MLQRLQSSSGASAAFRQTPLSIRVTALSPDRAAVPMGPTADCRRLRHRTSPRASAKADGPIFPHADR